MVEGFSLVETVVEPRFGSLCISLKKTNPHIPRPRSVQKMRIPKLGLNLHLSCFRVDTCCPSLAGLTGCRKITTLASFPFISATEPKKVLHLQLVRL